MTDASITLGIDGRPAEQGARVVNAALGSVKKEAGATVAATDKTTGAFDRLKQATFGLRGALGGVAAAFSAREIVQASDQWRQIESRLSIVTRGTRELATAQSQLFRLAQESRQPLEGIANLYTRIGLSSRNNATVMRNLGAITEVFAKGLAITGESAQAAQGAITQFAQGIASNFNASGQELQSLIEQAPQVAQALADGLNEIGVASKATVGDLKKLAQDGILTGTTAARALAAQLDNIQEKFSKMSLTIGQSMTKLDNAFMRYIGITPTIRSGTNSIALAISSLADNFDALATAAIATAAIFSARAVGPMLQARAAMIASEASYARAILSGRAVALAGTEAVRQRAEAEALAAAQTVKASQSRIAAMQAEQAQITRHIALLAAEAEAAALTGLPRNNRAMQDRLEMNRDLIASRRTLATTTAALSFEENVLAGASARAATAQTALAAATAETTLASRAATVASRALSGALALVGGPWGAAILALGAAFYYLRDSQEDARAAAEHHKTTMEGLENVTARLEGRSDTLSQQLVREQGEHIDNAEAMLKEAEAALTLLRARQAGPEGAYALAKIGDTSQRDALAKEAERKQQEIIEIQAKITKARYDLNDYLMKGTSAQNQGGDDGIRKDIEEKTKALDKLNEKMRESLALADADLTASRISDRERAVAKALVEGESAAREDYNKKLRSSAELMESERILIGQRAAATYDLEEQLEKEGDARQRIKQYVEETLTPLEKYQKLRAEIEADSAFAKTPEELEGIHRKLEQLSSEAEPMGEIFRRTAEGITDSFTQAFKDILDGNGGFKGLVSSITNLFKDMLARMAVLAIAQPVIVPIIQAVGGAAGLSASTISGVTKEFGGSGGGASGAFSLSRIPSLSGFLSGNIGGFNAINQFGAKYLGTGLVGQGSVTGASLTGIGMNAGIGGFAASMLGLGSGNGFLDAGLGLAGSYGGSALASLLGAGSFAGPAGIIGAFALTALGSLFKKKPSSKMQTGSLGLASGEILGRGGLTGDKFDQGNFDMVTTLSQLAGGIGKLFGATGALQLAAGNRNGLEYAFTDDTHVFDADNPMRKSFQNANDLVKSLTKEFAEKAGQNLSESLKIAMENIDFGKTEEALKKGLEDLTFAAGFDKLGEFVPTVADSKKAMDELTASYDKAEEIVKRLGLSEEKLAAARERDIGLLRSVVNQSALNSLYEQTDPRGLARYNEQIRFGNQFREVQAVNGNLEAVYALHRINMLRIDEQYNREEAQNRISTLQEEAQRADSLAQSYKRVGEALQNAIQGLRLGSLSTLSPLAKLEESRTLFSQTLDKALNGSVEERIAAAEALPGIGQGLLELSQAYNSSNEIFANDFSMVQRGLEEARDAALTQTDVQVSIATAAWKQIEVLEGGFSALQQAIAALGSLGKVGGADPYTGSGSNAAGRSLSEVTSNGLSVGQIESTARALLGNYTGSTGAGELSRMLAERGLNDAFVASLRAQGAKGFADGGYPSASSPYIVGERGPEIMAPRHSAMIIPFQNNAAILREMQVVAKELKMQNRMLQDGMKQQIKQAQITSDNTGRIAEDSTISKRKRAS